MQLERPQWTYRESKDIVQGSLQITVVADYGGPERGLDPAFNEVHQHIRRFDKNGFVSEITPCAVQAFSTLETGFWIGQLALHSEHPNLVIFSNTAPRGDIAWHGQEEQPFICALLDNGIPVFAVNSGYNLSFIKHRITGMWEAEVPNVGTQFRSRDQYTRAMMSILNGDLCLLGQALNTEDIPDVPRSRVGSIDKYQNIKTTIRRSDIPMELFNYPVLRVTINGVSNFVLNTLIDGIDGVRRRKIGDLCMVIGSSGGKKDPFVEFIRLYGAAAGDWCLLEEPIDDLGEILIDPVENVILQRSVALAR